MNPGIGAFMETTEKSCATCGRRIEKRKKWRDNFEEIKYCSQRCRSTRPSRVDRSIEATILRLLDQRSQQASICPSEVARSLESDNWKPLMERTRQAARRLVATGKVEITQRGVVVDPSTAKGPIRIRRAVGSL